MNTEGTTRRLAAFGGVSVPKEGAARKIRGAIVKFATPSIGGVALGDLPKAKAFVLALFFLASNAVVFAYTLWATTTTESSKRFLSLDKSAPGTTCKEVPLILNSAYQATYDGLWQSDAQFNFNKSIFVLSFNGQGVDSAQYSAAMGRLQQRMGVLGQKAPSRPPLWSAMTWAGLTLRDEETKMELYSSADAGIFFDATVSKSFLASALGVCRARPGMREVSSAFDVGRKQHVIRLPLAFQLLEQDWKNSSSPQNASGTSPGAPGTLSTGFQEPCPSQGLWFSNFFRLSTQTARGYAELGFDVRITTLVMGLNAGTISTDTLVRLDNVVSRTWGLIGYTDPYYQNPPLPYPLYCLDKARAREVYGIFLTDAQLSGPEVCFIVSSFKTNSLLFVYPIATQVQLATWGEPPPGQPWTFDLASWQFSNGSTFRISAPCKCPKDQLSPRCNQFYTFAGFFYDLAFNRTNTVLFGIKMQSVVLSSRDSGDYALTEYLERALIYSEALSTSTNGPIVDMPIVSWRNETSGQIWDYSWAAGLSLSQLAQREFQVICDGKCGLIFFYTYSYKGETSANTPLNKYDVSLSQLIANATQLRNTFLNMDLPQQMCVDTLSQPRALSRLAQRPPVTLVQAYFECQNTPMAAFTASIGNAAATSGLYVSIGWLVFGLLYVALLKRREKNGGLVLTHDAKGQLEEAQAQIRNELLHEGLVHVAGRSGVPGSFAARVDRLRCLFVDGEEDWQYCGREVTARILAADQDDDGQQQGQKQQQEQEQQQHMSRRPSAGYSRETKRQSFSSGGASERRISLTRDAALSESRHVTISPPLHPLQAALQTLPAPVMPGAGRRASGRGSLASAVHQL